VKGGEGKGGHHNPDVVFTETGFRNWKAALDIGNGFQKHSECSAHRLALSAYSKFLTQKLVDSQIQAVRKFPATISMTGSSDQTKSKMFWKYLPNFNRLGAMTRTNQPIIVLCVNFCRTTYLNGSTSASLHE